LGKINRYSDKICNFVSMPQFSIITVVKNNAARMQKTASSILEQNDQNFEWVIWDNHSNDGTAEYIRDMHLSNVKYHIGTDHSIYDAMNKALSTVDGKQWVFFLNAGDVFTDEGAVGRIINEISSSSASVLFADVYYDNNKVVQNGFTSLGIFKSLCHQSIVMKKDQLGTDIQFNTEYKVAADFDMLVGLEQRGIMFEKMAQPFSIYETGGFSDIHYTDALSERKRIFKRQLRNPFQYWLNLLNLQRLVWKQKRK